MLVESYLRELADCGRPLKIAKLTNLSALTCEERQVFAALWPQIDPERRLQVVQQLNELAEDNVELDFSGVFWECLSDSDARVRVTAIDGLWEYEERDLIAPLNALLGSDEDVQVRAGAALALGRFVVLGEFGSLRPSDVTAIEDALTATINDAAETEEVRARAIEAIGARSEPWVRDLIAEAYNSGAHRLQVSAVHAMGRSCDAYWLPDVIQQLHSYEAELRYEAAVASGMIGDKRAVSHLSVLMNDMDSEVQEMAIEALGEIGGSEARAVLTRELNHPEERVRTVVREVLSSMDLAGALGDDDFDEEP
jgi:HEAT repeat protein